MIKKLFLWVSLNLNKDLHRAGRYNNMIQYLIFHSDFERKQNLP